MKCIVETLILYDAQKSNKVVVCTNQIPAFYLGNNADRTQISIIRAEAAKDLIQARLHVTSVSLLLHCCSWWKHTRVQNDHNRQIVSLQKCVKHILGWKQQMFQTAFMSVGLFSHTEHCYSQHLFSYGVRSSILSFWKGSSKISLHFVNCGLD